MKPDERPLDEEAAVAALVRRALPREPGEAARDRARAAVAAEWRAALADRRGGSTGGGATSSRGGLGRAPRFALAASLLLAGVAALFTWFSSQEQGAGPVVAHVERGSVTTEGAALGVGDAVASARWLTADGSGALLRLDPALSLRLAAGTEARLASATQVELRLGRLFVDALPGADTDLVVATSAGEVRHLGTQYEVVARGEAVEVAVREGRIRLASPAGSAVDAGAGELVEVRPGAAPRRQVIADPEARFAWIAELPARVEIEGLPLARFLEWYSRETGRSVTFTDATVQAGASGTILSGSVDGLAPEAALDVVAASAGLAVDRRPGALVVHRRPDR